MLEGREREGEEWTLSLRRYTLDGDREDFTMETLIGYLERRRQLYPSPDGHVMTREEERRHSRVIGHSREGKVEE